MTKRGHHRYARQAGPRGSRGRALVAGWLIVAVVLNFAVMAPVAHADPPVALLRPVPGQVLRQFDPPAVDWQSGHRGVDLAATVGEPVRAPADGTVTFAQNLAGRGVITIELTAAPGYRITLEPVAASVAQGLRVSAGQIVGVLEPASGAHVGLHWGLRHGTTYLNPLAWTAQVNAPEVRLLPADATPVAVPVAAGSAPRLTPAGTVRPAEGPITSQFGMRLHPILHEWKLHDGVDIGAPCGAPVYSALPGIVTVVAVSRAYGNRVIIDHGIHDGRRLTTAYNHLASFQVSVGASVQAGTVIGAVGSTGWSTGCHLHFMSWVDGQLADPTGLLG